jgi:FMN phosphatase YigB (HAD superfamily)
LILKFTQTIHTTTEDPSPKIKKLLKALGKKVWVLSNLTKLTGTKCLSYEETLKLAEILKDLTVIEEITPILCKPDLKTYLKDYET